MLFIFIKFISHLFQVFPCGKLDNTATSGVLYNIRLNIHCKIDVNNKENSFLKPQKAEKKPTACIKAKNSLFGLQFGDIWCSDCFIQMK